MWNENGAGAILWVYLVIGPIAGLIQLILVILKTAFYFNSKK